MSSPTNGAGGRTPIDYVSLARALLDQVEHFLAQWLPGGRIEGHEYLGPRKRDGGVGDSLKVNLITGAWAYFGGGDSDKGGDLTSLYAWLEGKNNRQAALELMESLGWLRTEVPAGQVRRPVMAPPPEPTPAAAAAAVAADGATAPVPRKIGRWRSVLPVPKHAPTPKRFVWRYHNAALDQWVELEAVRTWEYAFEGERFGYVARFERISSQGEITKETLPYTWCEDTQDAGGGHKWHWKQWEAPRPLYVPATLLSGDPARVPVVIVEGEKCAMAGHELLGHEFDFVSWPGGAKAWALARWSWLMGRTVYLWPDADAKRQPLSRAEREADVDPQTKPLLPLPKQPGYRAMVGIGSLLEAEHGCSVFMCRMELPGVQPDGWDIADAIAAGWSAEQVRDHIRAARAFVPPDEAARAAAGGPVTPHAARLSTPTKASAGEGRNADTDTEADDGWGWTAHLMRAEKTQAVRAVRENVVLALDGRPDKGVPGIPDCAGLIRFNEFTNNIEKVRPSPWGTPAGDWLEADELLMGDWLVREWYMPSMARQALEEAVIVVARRHSYHPLRERMVALRGTWDQVPRLATWLRRVCLEEDEWDDTDALQQYLALAGSWFVMGMVARVLPEDNEDVDGDAGYQLERARVIESGFTGEYWREVAGFHTELSRRDCGLVLDILDMFRVITFSIRRLERDGTTVNEELRYRLEFQGFDHNDGLESHMASYVEFLMSDGRWSELQPQVKNNDDGNSHSLMLDIYKRMLAEHRRIKASRDRGYHREDYLLSLEELEQIAAARVHPSRRS